MPPRLAGIIHAREREDLFPVYAHFRLLYADPNMEIKGESPSWEWVYDDIYYSVELSPRGSRQTCQYRIVRVAQKLATIPKLETERVHPYYFFERGFEEEVGKGSRPVQPPPFYENCTARSSCPERSAEICYSHLAINSRYFISNTRSAARGMPRDDRSFFSRSRFVVERLSLTVFAPNHEEFLKKYRNL